MRFKDFEIRPTIRLDGYKPIDCYDVVKWYKTAEPVEVVSLTTGDKRMEDTFCFSIAQIWYNEKEPCWEFKSVGTRFLENCEKGLCEYILKFIEMVDIEKRLEEDGL